MNLNKITPMKFFAADAGMEVLFAPSGADYYYALNSNDPQGDFYAKNLPPGHVLLADADERGEDALLKSPQLTDQLKKNGVEAFWPFVKPTPELLEWGKANHIGIFAAEALFAQNFENKLVFDRFLRERAISVPEGGRIESIEDLKEIAGYPLVIQLPESHGAQGTYLVHDPESAKEIIESKKLRLPILWRQFVTGIPLGATLLIGENEFELSALRMQLTNKNLHGYMGIQWCPSSSFSAKANTAMTELLSRLAQALQKAGYRGVANIDLLLAGELPFIIECNPRMSLSSTQMCHATELFHGLNFVEERIRAISGKKLSRHIPQLPSVSYGGTTLDLDYFGAPLTGRRQIGRLESGIYIWDKDGLNFETSDIHAFQGPEKVFICNSLPREEIIQPKADFGFLMTNAPLFKVNNGREPLAEADGFFKALVRLMESKTA